MLEVMGRRGGCGEVAPGAVDVHVRICGVGRGEWRAEGGARAGCAPCCGSAACESPGGDGGGHAGLAGESESMQVCVCGGLEMVGRQVTVDADCGLATSVVVGASALKVPLVEELVEPLPLVGSTVVGASALVGSTVLETQELCPCVEETCETGFGSARAGLGVEEDGEGGGGESGRGRSGGLGLGWLGLRLCLGWGLVLDVAGVVVGGLCEVAEEILGADGAFGGGVEVMLETLDVREGAGEETGESSGGGGKLLGDMVGHDGGRREERGGHFVGQARGGGAGSTRSVGRRGLGGDCGGRPGGAARPTSSHNCALILSHSAARHSTPQESS